MLPWPFLCSLIMLHWPLLEQASLATSMEFDHALLATSMQFDHASLATSMQFDHASLATSWTWFAGHFYAVWSCFAGHFYAVWSCFTGHFYAVWSCFAGHFYAVWSCFTSHSVVTQEPNASSCRQLQQSLIKMQGSAGWSVAAGHKIFCQFFCAYDSKLFCIIPQWPLSIRTQTVLTQIRLLLLGAVWSGSTLLAILSTVWKNDTVQF